MARSPKSRTSLSKKELARRDKLIEEITNNIKHQKKCEMHDCDNYVVLGSICDPCHQAYYQEVGGPDMAPNVANVIRKVHRDIEDFMWGRGLDDE